MPQRLSETLAKAASYLYVTEWPPGSNRSTVQADCDKVWWLGFSRQGIAWCGSAIDLWVGRDLLPSSMFSTAQGAAAFQRIRRFDQTPEVGAIAFETFSPNRGISHVELVTKVRADGRIETIAGNTSINGSQDNGGAVLMHDGVNARRRSSIVGFGHVTYAPEEDEEIDMVLLRLFGYQDIYIVGAGPPIKAPDMPGVNEMIALKVCKPLQVVHSMSTFRALTGFDPNLGTPMPGE